VTRVLVTGGTGFLGSYLVERLLNRGHEVNVLSRRPPAAGNPRATYMQGDVLTGQGLREAIRDTEAVIHAATSFRRKARQTEIEGTRNTLAAALAAGSHFVYVSIVGVHRNRLPYYKAKLEAEKVVESAPSGWTIQRATQFHELAEAFLSFPAMPATRHMAFQLVDAGDVSERLVDIVEAGPSGRAGDYGGPQVLPIREIESLRRRITGKRGHLLPVPPVGFFGDFDRGSNLCPDHALGRRTWEEWLGARRGS
jgi:uncharacterized protein YbjT (DUF2867 family)